MGNSANLTTNADGEYIKQTPIVFNNTLLITKDSAKDRKGQRRRCMP